MNETLRAAREASGKTQARVAREVGISEQLYQRYEYGQTEPGVRTAIRIARAVYSNAETLWHAGEPDGNRARKKHN